MQSFLKLCIIISLLGFVSLAVAQDQDPTYIYHFCDNTTVFIGDSPYKANVNTLLSSLNPTGSGFDNGFYHAKARTGNSIVYGLFQCREDLASSTCRNCVRFASNDVLERCPIEKEVFIWYDECMLRYTNKLSIYQMSTNPTLYMWNPQSVSNSGSFTDVLIETMDKIVIEAANTPRKFAAKKANFTSSQTLYSLVKCTQDITASDCNKCLQRITWRLSTNYNEKQGGRVLSPNCNIRFELYPFYNETYVERSFDIILETVARVEKNPSSVRRLSQFLGLDKSFFTSFFRSLY